MFSNLTMNTCKQYSLCCISLILALALCSCSAALNPWHGKRQDKLVDFKKRRPPRENAFIASGGMKKDKKNSLLPQTVSVAPEPEATQSLPTAQVNAEGEEKRGSTSEKLLNIFKKEDVIERKAELSSTAQYNALSCVSRALEAELRKAYISDSELQAAKSNPYPELSAVLGQL